MVVHRFSHTATYSSYSSFLLRLSMGPKPEYSLRHTLCPCREGRRWGSYLSLLQQVTSDIPGTPERKRRCLQYYCLQRHFVLAFLDQLWISGPLSLSGEGERKGGVEWWKTPSFFGSFCLGTLHFSPCRLGYTIALGGDHHTACLLVQNVSLNVSTTKASEEKNK